MAAPASIPELVTLGRYRRGRRGDVATLGLLLTAVLLVTVLLRTAGPVTTPGELLSWLVRVLGVVAAGGLLVTFVLSRMSHLLLAGAERAARNAVAAEARTRFGVTLDPARLGLRRRVQVLTGHTAGGDPITVRLHLPWRASDPLHLVVLPAD